MISDLRLVLCGYRENVSTFWIEVVQEASGLDIDEPVLPRTRYAPRRIDDRAHLLKNTKGLLSSAISRYVRRSLNLFATKILIRDVGFS